MLLDFANIELSQKGELYHNLYEKIKEAVECGIIKNGEKLPSVREAASVLGVSRTTVENAYTRLCIEGIAESVPQVGYFISKIVNTQKFESKDNIKREKVYKYDFSSRKIDTSAADTEVWKRTMRSVLWDTSLLTSYGEKQGEYVLREVLASYSYKARGVRTTPEDIVIGAGVGPLLNILCGLLGRNVKVGIENGGFKEAQGIFADYGIETVLLESDVNGATLESIKKEKIDILFLLPSALSRISINSLNKRRNDYYAWANEGENRYIIEDDYNGELRYTARTVSSFQGRSPEKTVYIGSFSKLLLPSVRIAYMVLPKKLKKAFENKPFGYNQTCGKTEQLALAEYILKGHLEKHLRRLRRIYYNKSQILIKSVKEHFKGCEVILYESSLSILVKTDINEESKTLRQKAENYNIRIEDVSEMGSFKLSFGSIGEAEIDKACRSLADALYKKS